VKVVVPVSSGNQCNSRRGGRDPLRIVPVCGRVPWQGAPGVIRHVARQVAKPAAVPHKDPGPCVLRGSPASSRSVGQGADLTALCTLLLLNVLRGDPLATHRAAVAVAVAVADRGVPRSV
jgi:hypothetical protein